MTGPPDQLLTLTWKYGEPTITFSSGNPYPQEIESFNLRLLSYDNVTLISDAIVNVSTSLNDTSIECRNTIPVTGSSIRQQVTFNVKSKDLPIFL